MIRLFKLIFVIVILLGAYYSYKNHSESSALWHSLTTPQNVQIKFPVKPEHTQKIRDFPVIGQAKLQIYQQQINDELFVYIELQTRKKDISELTLNDLEPAILAMNATDTLEMSDKTLFELQSNPAMDYAAHDKKGNLIYCRTVKKNNQLISIIYGSQTDRFSKKRHKQFFNSLKL